MEEDQIIEVWDVFKEYISDKNKDTAANHFVYYLLGKDVEISILQGLVGYDTHLDDAISLVVDEDETDGYDDNEDYSYDEDED